MIAHSLMLLASLSSGVFACGDGFGEWFHLAGRVHLGRSTEHLATLDAYCGALHGPPVFTLALDLPDQDARESVAAEWPDAPSLPAGSASVQLNWSTASTRASLAGYASGRSIGLPLTEFLTDPEQPLYSFVIEGASASDTTTAFFAALANEPGTLTWSQPAAGGTRLVARFELNAAAAIRLQAAAAMCRAAASVQR